MTAPRDARAPSPPRRSRRVGRRRRRRRSRATRLCLVSPDSPPGVVVGRGAGSSGRNTAGAAACNGELATRGSTNSTSASPCRCSGSTNSPSRVSPAAVAIRSVRSCRPAAKRDARRRETWAVAARRAVNQRRDAVDLQPRLVRELDGDLIVARRHLDRRAQQARVGTPVRRQRDVEVTARRGERPPGRGRARRRGRRAIEVEVRERSERADLERQPRAAVLARRPRQRLGVVGLTGDLVAEVGQLDAGQPGERGRARELDRAQRRGDPRPIGRPDLAPTDRARGPPPPRPAGPTRHPAVGGERGQRRDVVGERSQALAPLVGDGGAAQERDRISGRPRPGGRRRGARRRHGGRRRARPTRRATDRPRAPAAAAAWRTPRVVKRQPAQRRNDHAGRDAPERANRAPHEPASPGPTTSRVCRAASISPRKARKRAYSSGAIRERATSRNDLTRTTSPSALTSR